MKDLINASEARHAISIKQHDEINLEEAIQLTNKSINNAIKNKDTMFEIPFEIWTRGETNGVYAKILKRLRAAGYKDDHYTSKMIIP